MIECAAGLKHGKNQLILIDQKIDNFIDNMKPFGIIEMCRTGIVALERGSESILSK